MIPAGGLFSVNLDSIVVFFLDSRDMLKLASSSLPFWANNEVFF